MCSLTRAIVDTEYLYLACHSASALGADPNPRSSVQVQAKTILNYFSLTSSKTSSLPNIASFDTPGEALPEHPFFKFSETSLLVNNADDNVIEEFEPLRSAHSSHSWPQQFIHDYHSASTSTSTAITSSSSTLSPSSSSTFVLADCDLRSTGGFTSSADRSISTVAQQRWLLLRRASLGVLIEGTLPATRPALETEVKQVSTNYF